MAINMRKNADLSKLSTGKMIMLHILPGIINIITILVLIPLVESMGVKPIISSVTAGYLAVFISMITVQFGILLYISKKTNASYDISHLIIFNNKSKIYEYIIFIAIVIIWAMIVSTLLEPMENGIRDSLFSFVPDSMALRNVDLNSLPKNQLIIAALLGVLANGLIAPITEETYFRGYLLPRIKASSKLAPIISAILFSLYHFFSPWQFLSRVLTMVPVYYWVVKRKNIKFSLLAHLLINCYTSIALLLTVL